jgi:hypothetical protein
VGSTNKRCTKRIALDQQKELVAILNAIIIIVYQQGFVKAGGVG